MKMTGIAELKASLSEYLAKVKSGEDVIVTDRGRPVARISRVTHRGTPSGSVDDLIRSGLVRGPERRVDKSFWSMPRGRDRKASVRAALTAERDQGR